MPAPVPDTRANNDPLILGLQLLEQLEYLGNQFSGSLNLSKGYIPIDITSAREIDTGDIENLVAHGGILATDSTPLLERVNGATDKALRLEWAAAVVAELQFPPITMPPDLDDAQDVEVHLLTAKDANANTVSLDVQAWDGVGDTEMGSVIAAVPQALSEQIVTLAAANITGHPLGFLNIALIPGAHAGDVLYLYAAWLEYTRI